MVSRFTTAPDLGELEDIARYAFHRIPIELRCHAEGVVIHVKDFPDAETEHDLRLESPFDLLGLYRGVSLDQKSVFEVPADIDMIFLYRRPILDYWLGSGEDITHIVRHVLIHEIGHHFGLSDEDMEKIEGSP